MQPTLLLANKVPRRHFCTTAVSTSIFTTTMSKYTNKGKVIQFSFQHDERYLHFTDKNTKHHGLLAQAKNFRQSPIHLSINSINRNHHLANDRCPTRLRLSCRALLIIVSVRPYFYSAGTQDPHQQNPALIMSKKHHLCTNSHSFQ